MPDLNVKSDNLPIGILIGIDYYHNFFLNNIKKGNEGPVASETILGWVLSGKIGSHKENNNLSTHFMKCTVEEDNLRQELKKFWSIEQINDDCVVDQFKANISFNGDRYVAKLPFRFFLIKFNCHQNCCE